jgi:LemA protein
MTPLIIVLIVVAVLLIAGIAIYNRIIRDRNRVDEAFSQIDVQLRRRHDLIPNLVETVKGYAAHERETLEAVVNARSAAVEAKGVAETAQTENLLTGALRQLFALSENYPDLKANQNFLALQEELSTTENKVAFARQFYNDRVRLFNNRIQTFPGIMFTGIARVSEREYFETEDDSREVPTVEF